jgi:5-methylcytosine-specific restriction protein A
MREELVLALELFMRKGVNAPQADAQSLSDTLRALPIERHLAQDPAFRSRAAVRRKLGNFEYVATDGRAGYAHFAQLDRAVYDHYVNAGADLFADADAIRQGLAEIGALSAAEQTFVDAEAAEGGAGTDEGFEEGELRARLHLVRERKRAIVGHKKQQVMKREGRLACEVCGLDFAAAYGPRGAGFIEAHHLTPLSEVAPGQRTNTKDLALVCANCHRMIHRRRPWATLDELRAERATARSRAKRGA